MRIIFCGEIEESCTLFEQLFQGEQRISDIKNVDIKINFNMGNNCKFKLYLIFEKINAARIWMKEKEES